MAEFTEIIDTDQDGVVDRYNNLDDFGKWEYQKPMPYVLMVKEGFTLLKYGIAQWPHFLYSKNI